VVPCRRTNKFRETIRVPKISRRAKARKTGTFLTRGLQHDSATTAGGEVAQIELSDDYI
jgi:hypothetical protein